MLCNSPKNTSHLGISVEGSGINHENQSYNAIKLKMKAEVDREKKFQKYKKVSEIES